MIQKVSALPFRSVLVQWIGTPMSYQLTHTFLLPLSHCTGPDDEDAVVVPPGVTLEPGEYMVLCEDVHFQFGIGMFEALIS